jgi:CDGSH-type Zn-finger protein/uncharacterized Fe-S cluster protein YjdI
MTDKLHVFEGKGIRVTWSKARCIHSAECIRGLPLVFQPGGRPWVKPEAGTAQKIAEVIERCPTGALHYERLDGGSAEAAATANTVTPQPDGPLFVRGQVEIMDAEGNLILRDTRVALCRCGGTSNKPFCDGSHRMRGFLDEGEVFPGAVKPGESPGAILQLTIRPGGPLKARGAVVVKSADGLVRIQGGDAAFCRCGASRNKPFCDRSHERVGFESESSAEA